MKSSSSKIITRLFTLIFIALLFNSCGNKNMVKRLPHTGEINAVVTTNILADAVSEIGQGRLKVESLMGAGVDPHLFKASEGDVRKLADADIIIYNGLLLEGKMNDVFSKLERKRIVIAAAELLPSNKLRKADNQGSHFDPHVWFDLALWKEMVVLLSQELAKVDTAFAQLYLSNGKRYSEQIELTEIYIKSLLNDVEENQRVLITAHDAFGYFGNAYGYEVRGLQGVSTVSEFGLADLNNLIDFIVDRKLKAIFVESSIPSRSIEALQSGVRAKGHEVIIGGELYSDALGEIGSGADNYLDMVQKNIQTIVNALK